MGDDCYAAGQDDLCIYSFWPSDDDDNDNHYHVSSYGLTFIFTTKKTMLQEIPGQFRLVASLFAKTSTAVNPFIYFFMSEGFRKDTSFVFRRFQNLLVQLV